MRDKLLARTAVANTDQYREEKAELELVLASDAFHKSPNLSKLLTYLCNKYFNGCSGELKEYNIGVEAMGRPADFDPTANSSVRVDAHRLREKLKKFYEGEGRGHSLRILIDPGKYAPRFIPLEEASAQSQNPLAGLTHPHRESQSENLVGPARTVPAQTQSNGRRSLTLLIGCIVLFVVAGVAYLLGLRRFLPSTHPVSLANPSRLPTAVPIAGYGDSIRILCGYEKGKYIDHAGNVWSGDQYFTGGTPLSQRVEYLARASDSGLYQTFRSGQFSYDIPLKPGNYEAHLYFAETHYGPGTISGGGETSRLFNVLMNGKPLLKIFDIIKDSGGNNIADVRVFKDVGPAADGYLHLKFDSLIDVPILNAIEIEPAPPGKINPIRIVAQNNHYTDHSGNIWNPDRYFNGGQLAIHNTRTPVHQTDDPSLFVGERFGNFSYAIPVAPGKYKVTLFFAETYWGVEGRVSTLPDQNGSLEGGVGSRIFDVYCNGVRLLGNFDISQEAGGTLMAVEKTFHNLEPNAQGKLVLSFVPTKDYACLNALEVVDEGK